MQDYSIYIVLTRSRTIVSKLIHVVSQEEYTHAAISFDRSLQEMYSFGRKYKHVPFIGRFRRESFNEGVFRAHNNIPGIVIEVKVTEEKYLKAKSLLNNFIENSSVYKYHYLGLLYNYLQKEANIENRFICSEFVYHILKESDIIDIDMSSNLVRPETLRTNLRKNIVFEGDLKSPNRRLSYRYLTRAN